MARTTTAVPDVAAGCIDCCTGDFLPVGQWAIGAGSVNGRVSESDRKTMPFSRQGLTFATAIAVFIALTGFCFAGASERPVTGKQLQQVLQQRRGTVANGLEVRQAFHELQTATNVAIVLDRRVDPTTQVQLETDFVTVQQTARLLAEKVDSRVAFADTLLYVAPPPAAARFRTLVALNTEHVREKRRDLAPLLYAALLKEQDVSWPRLSVPRDLLKQQCEQRGLKLQNPEAIPHDLWREARLPRLTFAQFATLVLNQFDLSFRLDVQGSVVVQPLPEDLTVAQRHRLPVKDRDRLIANIQTAVPKLRINWQRGTATVRATVEQHDLLRDIISGRQQQADPDAGLLNKRFTVTLPSGTQIGQVLATLRRQNIEVRFEGQSAARQQQILQRQIELEADRMPARDFLQQVFAGAGVTIDVQQNTVTVKDADNQAR